MLNEIALAAGALQNTDQVLDMILTKALAFIHAEQGSILLSTTEKDKPFHTLIRQDGTSALRPSYHVGTHITGYVLYHRKPLLVKELRTDPRFETTDEERSAIHSVVCVPVFSKGELLGALLMVNKKKGHAPDSKEERAFDEEDLRILTIVAGQVGQLLDNARLQEEARNEHNRLLAARLEAEKEHELREIKTRFFTNISHELLTPLTLVLGPLDRLGTALQDKESKADLEMMRRNGLRLLLLIRQLLELSSLDAGQVKLSVVETDLVHFLEHIVSSLLPLAERKKVSLSFHSDGTILRGFVDRDKIEKILTNLISNAIRFTPAGGEVSLRAGEDGAPEGEKMLECTVTDTGSGIAVDHIGRIFDRFYQIPGHISPSHHGAGIGLALTKELVGLHKGSISVTSTVGEGTTFIVRFPTARSAYRAGEIVSIPEADRRPPDDMPPEMESLNTVRETVESAPLDEERAKKILLVVDDNADVRRYIRSALHTTYRVEEAADGRAALAAATERIPDLVISDVIMPEMDGLTFCRHLKSDERTSHIPVILLTARAGVENTVEGLDVGADDYIVKPFAMRELQARIRNLLVQRMSLQEKYQQHCVLEPAGQPITSTDEKFLRRALDVVNAHLSEPGLDTATFAREVFMSRMQLNRKLQALTGRSTHEFIRNLRLQKAASLLAARWGNITEVAYEVGFSDISHFAKAFRKQYGVTPSEYNPSGL